MSGMMTESQLKSAANRLRDIEATRESLKMARHKLQIFNKHGLGKKWTVTIQIRAQSTPYSYDSIDQIVVVPAAVIQRQMVDECERLKRKLFQLGGEDR